MIIKKIVKLKNGKYKLLMDDNSFVITYDEVILKYNLLSNKNISDQLFLKLSKDNNYYDVYNKTIKYISVKMRSLKEINDYLKKYNLTKTELKSIINKLKEIGFINDENYTKAYINDSFNLTKKGPLLIKKELLKHDINETLIDEYLSKITKIEYQDKIDKLILKKIKSNNKYSNYILKQKLIKELINLGYNYDLIIDRIDYLLINDFEILNKEFDRVYKKYVDKLNNNELNYKIKQYLLKKGFDIGKINELLEEKNVY